MTIWKLYLVGNKPEYHTWLVFRQEEKARDIAKTLLKSGRYICARLYLNHTLWDELEM